MVCNAISGLYTGSSKIPLSCYFKYSSKFWKTTKHMFNQFQRNFFWLKSFGSGEHLQVARRNNFKIFHKELGLLTYRQKSVLNNFDENVFFFFSMIIKGSKGSVRKHILAPLSGKCVEIRENREIFVICILLLHSLVEKIFC